jgi:hypothetical protein
VDNCSDWLHATNVILCTIGLGIIHLRKKHARLLICASFGASSRWPEKYISLLPKAGLA